ncbi:MAG TPA: FecR domain-containing protein [Kofleriaceae bacterium]
MDALNERLANLGRAVAEVNAPDHDAIADARRRWARSARRTRSRRWAFVAVPAFAIAAAVIVLVATRTSEDERSLTYAIGDVPGERGQWIAAREPVRLRFSDGSQIDVARDAKVRVAATDQRGSTIDLEQGSLHAVIVHRDVNTWRFRTGPYTVLVKGTRFNAAWDSTHERFTLDLLEGKVEVTGPLIPAPVTVSAGQSVVAHVAEKRFEIRSVRTADATAPARADVEPRKQDVAQLVPPDGSPPATKPATPTKPRTTSNGVAQGPAAAATTPTTKIEKWREYLAARAYSSAITAAEQRGFDAVVADATSAELYALSDAARYAGRLPRARDALIALRARFGEQGKTAFLLGRIAADQKDAPAAIEWFDRYLQEQPGGPLAETATGRLIELYKPQDPARARKLAERYLTAYPDGSYSALARTLVEK